MATRKNVAPAVVCAENIVLLSMLNETPSPPHANSLVVAESKKKKTAQRILSPEKESALVRRISFLAAVTDDPNHIVATCIEELPSGDGMRVMLAINKGSPNSSSKALNRIQCGLENLFQLLSRVNAASSNTGNLSLLDADVFGAIVEMCKDRILTRLGYQAGYLATRKKSFLAGVLDQAARAVEAHYGKTQQADVAPFLRQTTNLVTLLQSWNGSSTSDPTTILRHLQPILLAISHFTKTINLAPLLSPLPPSTLDAGIKRSLPLRLLKLAKYRTTSLYLVRSAQTLPLFLHVKVLPISLPPPYFFREQTAPPKTSSLPARLSLCHTPTPASTLCQKLNIPPATANTQFLTNLTSALKEARIHAEVQLVAHYDLNPTPFRPRVIASSKDACYLCNLFVATHGGFHVPRTHGKLYKGWRLPVGVPGWEGLQERMNAALEARVRKAVGERMAVKGKWAVAFPNESTAWTAGGSMETLGIGGVLADVVSPKQEESSEPRQEGGEVTGEEQRHLLPEPSADKDDPGRDHPAGEPKLMSDISTERIISGASTLSPTASVPLTNHSSPVNTTAQQASSPRVSPRKTPPPTPPTPRDQPPGNGAPATSPPSPTPSLNHYPLQLDIPGDPTPSQRTTPPPTEEDPPPKGNATTMPSPTHPPLYISPLPSSLTTTSSPPTTTTTHSSHPPPAPSPPETENPKTILLPLSQSKTTIHRLHPPPSPPANYIYTTGTIDIYPSYTASPHGSDVDSYSCSPEPDNASPLSTPARGVVEMRIRWLPPAVAARVLRGRHETKITYLDRLPIGGDVDGEDPDRGYLAKGKDVVLVEVVRG